MLSLIFRQIRPSFTALALFLTASAALSAPVDDNEDDLIQAVLQPTGHLNIANGSVDLGELSQGAAVEVRFPFAVDGDGPVKILGINQDCGCLSSSLRAGQFLTPGTKDFIRVTLDTKSFAGSIDKTILVMTDEPKSDRLHRLRIKAKIRQMVAISPPLVRFDWTKGDKVNETIVTVRRLAQQTLSIEKVDFNRDNLDVDVEPVQDSWRIRIRWKGDVPVQPFQDMIRITAAAPYGNLQIPVLGHVNTAHH